MGTRKKKTTGRKTGGRKVSTKAPKALTGDQPATVPVELADGSTVDASLPDGAASPDEDDLSDAGRARQERDLARKERRDRAMAERIADEKRRRQAKRAATKVTPIDAARKKKEDVGKVELPIDDLRKYKMLAMEAAFERISNTIKVPIRRRFQQQLDQALRQATTRSLKFVEAQRDQAEAVNDIIDALQGEIPPDHIVTRVDAQKGVVICEFSPGADQVRMEVPELPDQLK